MGRISSPDRSSIWYFFLCLQVRLIYDVNPCQSDCAADPLYGVGNLAEHWDGKQRRQDGLSDERGRYNGGGQMSECIGNGEITDHLGDDGRYEKDDPRLHGIACKRIAQGNIYNQHADRRADANQPYITEGVNVFASALSGELVERVKDRRRACHQVAKAKGGMVQEVTTHHERRACKRDDKSKPKNAAQFFAKDEERDQRDP